MTLMSRVRHALVAPSAALAAGALLYVGFSAAPAMAIGYPAPGGIYAPFTDCPLHDPVMRLAAPGFAMGCIKSITQSGSFAINGIPVPITHPVTVQFGTYSNQDSSGNQVFFVVPPKDKQELIAEPEVIPNGLLLLVCSSGDPAVARLCTTAMTSGHTDLSRAGRAGRSDHELLTLGSVAFHAAGEGHARQSAARRQVLIGSDSDPIVLNPLFNPVGTLDFESDPDPVRFPNVAVLSISGSTLAGMTPSACRPPPAVARAAWRMPRSAPTWVCRPPRATTTSC